MIETKSTSLSKVFDYSSWDIWPIAIAGVGFTAWVWKQNNIKGKQIAVNHRQLRICIESAMEKNQKLFSFESKFLKFISIQPLDLISVHPRLRLTINVLYHLFWHFVVSHLAIIQTVTIVLNFDKTLDDIIDYAMIGSIYSYGYFCILCYWQFFWGELSRLMDFVRQNFRTRSAKGRAEKARRGFYICQFFQAWLSCRARRAWIGRVNIASFGLSLASLVILAAQWIE